MLSSQTFREKKRKRTKKIVWSLIFIICKATVPVFSFVFVLVFLQIWEYNTDLSSALKLLDGILYYFNASIMALLSQWLLNYHPISEFKSASEIMPQIQYSVHSTNIHRHTHWDTCLYPFSADMCVKVCMYCINRHFGIPEAFLRNVFLKVDVALLPAWSSTSI